MEALHTNVALVLSGEKGRIIGRAEYVSHPPQYMVQYLSADGRQVSDWFLRDDFNVID